MTQFFQKSVELLGCYRNCDILFPLAHLFPFTCITLWYSTLSSIWSNCMGSRKQITTKQTSSPSETLSLLYSLCQTAWSCHSSLYQYKNITNLLILYYQLLAETMSDMRNNLVPTCTNIQELFLPLSRVHSYGTRSSTTVHLKTFI